MNTENDQEIYQTSIYRHPDLDEDLESKERSMEISLHSLTDDKENTSLKMKNIKTEPRDIFTENDQPTMYLLPTGSSGNEDIMMKTEETNTQIKNVTIENVKEEINSTRIDKDVKSPSGILHLYDMYMKDCCSENTDMGFNYNLYVKTEPIDDSESRIKYEGQEISNTNRITGYEHFNNENSKNIKAEGENFNNSTLNEVEHFETSFVQENLVLHDEEKTDFDQGTKNICGKCGKMSCDDIKHRLYSKLKAGETQFSGKVSCDDIKHRLYTKLKAGETQFSGKISCDNIKHRLYTKLKAGETHTKLKAGETQLNITGRHPKEKNNCNAKIKKQEESNIEDFVKKKIQEIFDEASKESNNACIRGKKRSVPVVLKKSQKNMSKIQYKSVLKMKTKNRVKTDHECKICNKRYKSKYSLTYHELMHSDNRPIFACQTCDKKFTQKYCLKLHEFLHTGIKPYICEKCGKRFTFAKSLKYHIFTHTDTRSFLCDVCGMSFVTRICLRSHLETHSKIRSFLCTVCNASFKTRIVLRGHMRTHDEKKPHVCETCGKGFRRRTHLKIHYDTHSTKRAYECDICGQKFKQISTLQTHKRTRHMEKGRRNPYTCETCDKEFTSKYSLERHKLIHTGEKPFACEICGRNFRLLQFLEQHNRIHAREIASKSKTC